MGRQLAGHRIGIIGLWQHRPLISRPLAEGAGAMEVMVADPFVANRRSRHRCMFRSDDLPRPAPDYVVVPRGCQ